MKSMKSYAAKEWDKKYHNSTAHHIVKYGKFLPKDRPCDWCGEKVKSGYIHDACAEKERNFILDILY